MFGFLKRLFSDKSAVIRELIANGAIVIDVRSPVEFRKGHAEGTVNIPLSQVDHKLLKIRQYGKPVVTCCASGRRSGIAADRLQVAGVEAINGGSWQRVQKIIKDEEQKKVEKA